MSKIRETTISTAEKKFVHKCLADSRRIDGRAFDEFRELKIQFGKDWGCCYASLGKTKVLAQVSCEIQQPKSSRPSEGILNINIELNPLSAPHFEAGRQSELGVQLNRLLEKCLKDSKAVDLESLCIKMNEKVWALRLDVNVLNQEGNILDCASVAALGALAHFRRPDVTCEGEEFIIHPYNQRDPIPTVIHHYPVCITYAIFNGGEFIIADPSLLEESIADAYLTIGLNAYKELCGLRLGGKAELTPDLILSTTNKATRRVVHVTDEIKRTVEEDLNSRKENSSSIGLRNLMADEKAAVEDLARCLDQWTTQTRTEKKKRKKKEKQTNKEIKGEIESLGKGSAVLIPETNEEPQGWTTISSDEEEDNDVVFIQFPKEEVKTVEILDTDSEEEKVVILNADKKTKKRKK